MLAGIERKLGIQAGPQIGLPCARRRPRILHYWEGAGLNGAARPSPASYRDQATPTGGVHVSRHTEKLAS